IHPPLEMMLAEHLGAHPELITLVELFLPLKLITDPLCLRFIEVVRDSIREGVELMHLLGERDDESRTLAGFAAQVLSAPSKTGQDGSHQEAVESLILKFWRTELQRRRTLLEQESQSAVDEQSRDDKMALASQLTTDIKRLQRWDTGEAVLLHYQGE
ncbi:MAG: hypothetical protein WCL49_11530, partial [bacterium]